MTSFYFISFFYLPFKKYDIIWMGKHTRKKSQNCHIDIVGGSRTECVLRGGPRTKYVLWGVGGGEDREGSLKVTI